MSFMIDTMVYEGISKLLMYYDWALISCKYAGAAFFWEFTLQGLISLVFFAKYL